MSELALLVATDERLSGEVAAARAEVTQLADSQRDLLNKEHVMVENSILSAVYPLQGTPTETYYQGVTDARREEILAQRPDWSVGEVKRLTSKMNEFAGRLVQMRETADRDQDDVLTPADVRGARIATLRANMARQGKTPASTAAASMPSLQAQSVIPAAAAATAVALTGGGPRGAVGAAVGGVGVAFAYEMLYPAAQVLGKDPGLGEVAAASAGAAAGAYLIGGGASPLSLAAGVAAEVGAWLALQSMGMTRWRDFTAAQAKIFPAPTK
jgi:hypothetical protein